MATLEKRLNALETASDKDTDYRHKLSILVPDDTTEKQINQLRRDYRTEVYRTSADPFALSFLG